MNCRTMQKLERELGQMNATIAQGVALDIILEQAEHLRSQIQDAETEGKRQSLLYKAHFLESIVKTHPNWNASEIEALLEMSCRNPNGFLRKLVEEKRQKLATTNINFNKPFGDVS